MSKLIWKPVSHNAVIESLGRNSSFYFLQGEHLNFLFIHEANEASVLIISLDEFGVTIFHVLETRSDNFISKITGNGNYILMLDASGDLFYLKGIIGNHEITFNFTNVISFLSNDVILKWCKLAKLSNCLVMEGTSEGAAFIYHDNECVYSTMYTTTDISKGLSRLTTRRLNYFDWNTNYFMIKITGENARLINNKLRGFFAEDEEVLLIIEPKKLRFSKPKYKDQICSKPIPIDFQSESIISIMNFNEKGCIFIICKSGKIVCLKLKTVLRNFEVCQLFLGRKVYGVTGYVDTEIKLFWSDLKYLYVSAVTDNIESTKLQVIYKIGGVLHLVASNNNFLMVITRNACMYETRTNLVKPASSATLNSRSGLLTRIHGTAKILARLIEKIKMQEYFIEALEISKIPHTSNNMYIIVDNDSITLQNNTNCLFSKNLWRVQIEMDEFQRKKLEVRELHTDIAPKGSVQFEWKGKNSLSLMVTLFCDIFLPKAIIFIEVKSQKKGNAKIYEDSDLVSYSKYIADTYTFHA